MFVKVDATAKDPLYQQIHDQVVSGIATGELVSGMQLPSVRALATDLGINLHTVNKAYAVLRDEGYIRMKGRAGAYIADVASENPKTRVDRTEAELEEQLFKAALTYRANGGTRGAFLELAAAQAARAYGVVGESESAAAQKTAAPSRKSALTTRRAASKASA